MSISTQNIKIVVLFTLLVTTFLFSMIPLTLLTYLSRQQNPARRRRVKATISLLNCFTAGVFLGTCLLDLFPEVEEMVEKALREARVKTNFPVAECLVVAGFLLLLIVEQIVTRWRATHGSPPQTRNPLFDDGRRVSSATAPGRQLDEPHGSFSSSYGSIESHDHFFPIPVPTTNESSNSIGSGEPYPGRHDDREDPDGNNSVFGSPAEDVEEEEERSAPDPSRHSLLRPMMLLAALSLHSVFEGFAIGLQSTVDGVVQIFAALTLHKCVVAFSIGLSNVQSNFAVRVVVPLNALFSLMSPIGIGVGVAIENLADETMTHAVTGVLQGVACGTFLYVVFMEILPHEFMARRNRPDRLLKVLCLLVGLAVMVGILVLDPSAQ